MTSFLARTFALLADKPETICAVLGTSRQIMNCSAVPVILSSDETYDLICSKQPKNERKLLQVFSTFCDTMQFTEKLRIQNRHYVDFVKRILENLINKRYFTRTIRVVQLPCADPLIEACCSHDPPTTTTPVVFSNLRSLSIEDYGTLQNEQLKTICSLCPFLEELNILNQYDVTDEGVEFLLNLKQLKTLCLKGCFQNTNDGLQHLAKLSSLQTLDLTGHREITDSGLEHLENLSALQTLNLSYCGKITDMGIENLVHLSSLKTLDLEYCQLITDSGLQHLTKLPSLQSLNLCDCDEITASGIQHLAKLSSLRSLNLTGCDKVTALGCRVFSASTRIEGVSGYE